MPRSTAILLSLALTLQPLAPALAYASETYSGPLTLEEIGEARSAIVAVFRNARLEDVTIDIARMRARVPGGESNAALVSRLTTLSGRLAEYRAVQAAVTARDRRQTTGAVKVLAAGLGDNKAKEGDVLLKYLALLNNPEALAAVLAAKDSPNGQGLALTGENLPTIDTGGPNAADRFFDGTQVRPAGVGLLPGGSLRGNLGGDNPNLPFKPGAATVRNGEVAPLRLAPGTSAPVEMDRYGVGGGFAQGLRASYYSALSAATGNQEAGRRAFAELRGGVVADRSARTAELLRSLQSEETPNPELTRLLEVHGNAAGLESQRAFLADADEQLKTLDLPVLRRERAHLEARTQAALSVEESFGGFLSEVGSAHPELADSLALLQSSPERLSPQQLAQLRKILPQFYGGEAYRAFDAARNRLDAAESELGGFYDENPLLARQHLDRLSQQRFNWANILQGNVRAGTEFSPGELGAGGEVRRVVAGTEGERPGLWTETANGRSFESLDGRLRIVEKQDDSGQRVRVSTLAAAGGRSSSIEIRSLDPESERLSQKGRVENGNIVITETALRDGRRLERLDARTTAVHDAEGRRTLELDASALFLQSPGERAESAEALARSMVAANGWDESRIRPLTEFLRDGFKKNGALTEMRLIVLPDGTIQQIYKNGGGTRIDSASFAPPSAFASSPGGDRQPPADEALVRMWPVTIDAAGRPRRLKPTRMREYLPDGRVLIWNDRYGSRDAGIFTSHKRVTEVSVLLAERGSDGRWDRTHARVDRREDLDVVEDTHGTSFASMFGSSLNKALPFIPWLGEKGTQVYSGLVGGNQAQFGEWLDNPNQRLHGKAGMSRSLQHDAATISAIVEFDLDAEERAALDGRVIELRQRQIRRSGLRGRMLDDSQLSAVLGRPITHEERVYAFTYEIGAGTYGQLLADASAESSGFSSTALAAGGVTMDATENIAQGLPLIIALGGFGRLGGLTTTGRAATLVVSGVRLSNTALLPTVMSTWAMSIPEGFINFKDGLVSGDTNRMVEGGGRMAADAFFLAAMARDFSRGTRVRARARTSQRAAELLPEVDAQGVPEPVQTVELVTETTGGRTAQLAAWTRGLFEPIGVRVSELMGRARPETEADALLKEGQERVERYRESREGDAGIAPEELALRERRALEERDAAREIYAEAVKTGGELNGVKPGKPAGKPCAVCVLQAWARQLSASGQETTVPRLYRVIGRKFGLEFAREVRREGIPPERMAEVSRAIAESRGVGIESVPLDAAFTTMAERGRGAQMSIRTGEGYHQVFVKPLRGRGGAVEFFDPNAGGWTRLSVENFARLARGDALLLGEPGTATLQGRGARTVDARVEGGESLRIGADSRSNMDLMAEANKLLGSPEKAAKLGRSPAFFKKFIDLVREGSKRYEPARTDAQRITRHRQYKTELENGVQYGLRKTGLSAADVGSTGMSLRSMLGVVFSGKLEATDSFGDGAQYWAAKGTGGTTYTGAPPGRGEPAAVVVWNNRGNRLRHTIDYFKVQPKVDDIAYIVITDGSRTVVWEPETIGALRGSAVQFARWGTEGELLARENINGGPKYSEGMKRVSVVDGYRTYLSPSGR